MLRNKFQGRNRHSGFSDPESAQGIIPHFGPWGSDLWEDFIWVPPKQSIWGTIYDTCVLKANTLCSSEKGMYTAWGLKLGNLSAVDENLNGSWKDHQCDHQDDTAVFIWVTLAPVLCFVVIKLELETWAV